MPSGSLTTLSRYASQKRSPSYPTLRPPPCLLYTSTKAFLEEFASALSLADEIILADIYAAREKDTLGISSETLQEKIRSLGHSCHYFPTFEAIENYLLKNCTKDDLLITMGAGDVVKVGENLLQK